MNDENFEKKSTKKLWIIIAIVLVLIAAVVGGLFFLKSRNKPEKIFTSKLENVFEMTEKKREDITSGRIEIELTAEIDTDDLQIRAINPMIKAAKLKSVTEFDTDQKIFNQKLTALYDGEEVLDVDALVQNERIYLYLNELFSKYIDCTDLLEEELDLSTIFEESKEFVNEKVLDENLIKDIEQIIIEYIEKAEFTQGKDEVNGEKVTKTTCHLTERNIAELGFKILTKYNEYAKNEDIKDLIDELEDELKDENSFSEKNYANISLYTKGAKNEVVKATIEIISDEEVTAAFEMLKEDNKTTIKMIEDEDTIATIEILKEDKKTTISILADDVLLAFVITEDGKTTTMEILVNPEGTKLSEAISLVTVTVYEENENEGTIKFTVHAGPIMALEDDDYEDTKLDATLNIKYKVDYNARIEKRNVSNRIDINDFDEEDANEIMENIENNEILSSIFESLLGESAIMNSAVRAGELYEDEFENEDTEFSEIEHVDMEELEEILNNME